MKHLLENVDVEDQEADSMTLMGILSCEYGKC
jgi:hypothetical protein